MRANIMLGIVAVIIIVVAVLSIVFLAGNHNNKSNQVSSSTSYTTKNTAISTTNSHVITIQIYPASPYNWSLIGTANNKYATGTLHSPDNATLLATPSLWNLQSAQGNVNMTFYKNYLHVVVNLSKVQPTNPVYITDGIPEIIFGKESWWYPFTINFKEPSLVNLPMKISDLPYIYSFTNYSLFCYNGSIFDFAYDIYITTTPYPSALNGSDIELMIWLYWTPNIGAWSNFIYAGNLTIPTYINGTLRNLDFKVYVVPSNNLPSVATGVYMVSPIKLQGDIGIPLTYILQNLGKFTVYAGLHFDPSKYYLAAIPLGMEFNASIGGNALLGYYLYSWTLQVNATE